MQRALCESGALVFSREGKVLHRRAEAGFIVGGEETSRRAAILLLCLRGTQRGGRQDSAARIGIRVERKQLVTHLWTWRQWRSILAGRPFVGENRSAP